jgi:hypothetical protein
MVTFRECGFFGLIGFSVSTRISAFICGPPTTDQRSGFSESSNERFRTNSALMPPSAEQFMSSKKMPHNIGLTFAPGSPTLTVMLASLARAAAIVRQTAAPAIRNETAILDVLRFIMNLLAG